MRTLTLRHTHLHTKKTNRKKCKNIIYKQEICIVKKRAQTKHNETNKKVPNSPLSMRSVLSVVSSITRENLLEKTNLSFASGY